MPSEFVHLHLHSDYSLLDGACSIKGLAKLADEYKMPAVAITDHGFMGGAIEFYQAMNAIKVKPIIGCEAYISPTTRFDKDPNNPDIKGFHIVLLAASNDGYKNLCKLNAEAHISGFYYKPRIDKELLAKHSEGLIGLSACLKGEIDSAITDGKIKHAKKVLSEYMDIFGKGNFYLELMDHGIEEQSKVNKELILLSKEFDVPLVATNDVHYLKKEHAKAHDLMLCIQTKALESDEKRMRMTGEEFYFKNGVEMREVFKEIPEAVKRTLEVAEKCNVSIEFDKNHYPVYELPQGESDRKDYLRKICIGNMEKKYGVTPEKSSGSAELDTLTQRLDYELGVIDKSKYCSYFLVVWDFIKHAKDHGIPVGPGRGSGAGSLVAYLTGITDIDPLRYNLLFERFLNPERISPPDFDIDFCEKRREEVINYVRGKYGADSVAQIGTYGTLKAKQVAKDVARVLGRSFADGDKISKLIPNDPKMTLAKAKEESKELKELLENEPWASEVFRYAEMLESLNRNMSIHAAGVIIGDQRLDGIVPLAKGAGDEVITQYPAGPCEKLGLLKMDFLGLRTLTVIEEAVQNIRESRGIPMDIDKIPLDDKNTFDLLNKGNTVGVFQLESSGMQNLCRQFGVESIEHIIALIAIYRPGPMQFIPEFVGRKMGTTKIEYDHPKMEPILKETYGIMLYQEQIMQAVQVLAGFSLGQADMLRRAIGKKKEKEMAEQKGKFVKGCAETNGISEKIAVQIWEKIEKFAGYGFNKSHSAAYAFLAYRTAYLKANYPQEFMAATLSSEISNAEKIAFFINECREMRIDILQPDINKSQMNFTVDKDSIRFGLGAIKGVGAVAAKTIISQRKDGPYKTMLDFCERSGESLNLRMLDSMTRAGAFDSFGHKRSQLLATMEEFMSMAQSKIKDKASGQEDLFNVMMGGDEQNDVFAIQMPDIPEFDENELLKNEKELLGFYVTGNPLSKYSKVIEDYSTVKGIPKIDALANDDGVRIGGIIKDVAKKASKKDGLPYAIVQFEDFDGSIECMVYNRLFERKLKNGAPPSGEEPGAKEFVKDLLEPGTPLFIEGFVSQRDETEKKKIVADNIYTIDHVVENYTSELHLHLYEGSTSSKDVKALKALCECHQGDTKVILCLTCSDGKIAYIESSYKNNVRVSSDFLAKVQDILGERRFRTKPNILPPRTRPKYQPANKENVEQPQQ